MADSMPVFGISRQVSLASPSPQVAAEERRRGGLEVEPLIIGLVFDPTLHCATRAAHEVRPRQWHHRCGLRLQQWCCDDPVEVAHVVVVIVADVAVNVEDGVMLHSLTLAICRLSPRRRPTASSTR